VRPANLHAAVTGSGVASPSGPTERELWMYDVGMIAVALACFGVIFAIFYGLEKI
jgi:hypothetical protein